VSARVLVDGFVQDMLAVETELHGAFRRQREDVRLREHRNAAELIDLIASVIDRHLASLRARLSESGAGEAKLKNALGAVLGAAAGIYDRLRTQDRVSRMLRDDYTAVSFAIACYEMLHTTALAAEDAAVANLALDHLRDYAPAVIALSETMRFELIDELFRDHDFAADREAAERSVLETRRIWENQPDTPPEG